MDESDHRLARAFRSVAEVFDHTARLVADTEQTVESLKDIVATIAAADPRLTDPALLLAMRGEDTITQTLYRYERAMREQADRARMLRRVIARQHRAAQLRAGDA